MESKWGWALALACPGCAGGSILALGSVLGASLFSTRLALAVAAVGLLGALWARNAWKRRGESCRLPGHGH